MPGTWTASCGGQASPHWVAMGTMSQPPQELPVETHRVKTCPIYLGPLANTAHLDSCRHNFCMECIQPWAAVWANYPLCPLLRDTLSHWSWGRFQPSTGLGLRLQRWLRWSPSSYQFCSASPRCSEHGERSPSMPRQHICCLSWHWEQMGTDRPGPPHVINRKDTSWLRRAQQEPGSAFLLAAALLWPWI